MKTKNQEIIEETFYLGNIHITHINPNNYFPNTITEETLEKYFQINNRVYKDSFNMLAMASNIYNQYERNLDIQREKVKEYLSITANKIIVSETGFSSKTISDLKNNPKRMEVMSLENFEKLYQCANKS